ncbi:MAG TPA: DUF4149 domain-containing protein [Pyrinomonadaceae bacterium]|nr:DUF4149 domain-containing protein [Pyrinomonadaceae bacterium]
MNRLRMLLLAAWLGTAIFFSAVVAPSAFGVLRSFDLSNASEIAGTIVGRTLSTVNRSGAVLSLLLLLTTLSVRKHFGRASFIAQNVLLAIIVVVTAIGELVIAPRMVALRTLMRGRIDQVPVSDPARVAFAALHAYSVGALAVAMFAALVVLVLMVLGRERAVAE